MAYVYLLIAIIAEVVGTTALKASDGFTKWIPNVIVAIGYGLAFYFQFGAKKHSCGCDICDVVWARNSINITRWLCIFQATAGSSRNCWYGINNFWSYCN